MQIILLYYSSEDGERDIIPREEELTSLSITRPVSTIIPSFPLKRVRVNVTNVLDSLNLTQWRSKLRDISLPNNNNSKNMFVSVEQDILPCEEKLTSLSITHPVSAIIPSFPLKRVRVNVTNVLDSLNLTQWRSKLRDILLPNNSKCKCEREKTYIPLEEEFNIAILSFAQKSSIKTIVKKVKRKSLWCQSSTCYRNKNVLRQLIRVLPFQPSLKNQCYTIETRSEENQRYYNEPENKCNQMVGSAKKPRSFQQSKKL